MIHATASGGVPDLDDGRLRVLRDQLLRRAADQDLRLVHDDQAVAKLRRLFHVVGREQDRHAAALELADFLPEDVARLRVEAGGRLVEDEHPGFVEKSSREHESALHAARKRHDGRVPLLAKGDEVEQLVGAAGGLVGRDTEIAAVDDEILRTVKSGSRLSSCGQIPARALDVARVGPDVQPQNLLPSRTSPAEAVDHLHRRGLARPVRAEKAEALPSRTSKDTCPR